MSFYIPPSFVKNINSTFNNHSTRNKMVNGQLNNAVGMQKGKTLFTKSHQISPQPAIDQVTPAHSEAKWANRNPGTGWSQKEMVENPKGHSKAVKEGLRTLPTKVLAGATSVLGGMPSMLGSLAVAGGAYGLGRFAEGVVDFYSGAKNENMAAAKEELNKNNAPKRTGRQLREAVTTATNMAMQDKFDKTYLKRDESNPVYNTQPKKNLWNTVKQSMSNLPTPGSLTIKNIMQK